MAAGFGETPQLLGHAACLFRGVSGLFSGRTSRLPRPTGVLRELTDMLVKQPELLGLGPAELAGFPAFSAPCRWASALIRTSSATCRCSLSGIGGLAAISASHRPIPPSVRWRPGRRHSVPEAVCR